MALSIRCDGIRKGFVLPTYVAFAIISLDNHVNLVQVIGSTRCRGKAIRGSISQMRKGIAKAYQVRQVLKAIERLKRENEKK